MDSAILMEVLRKFRAALARQGVADARIVLFGSQADGTADEDSDIDVVVISRAFEGMEYWDRLNVLTEAIYEVWEPIEATAVTPAEWESGELTITRIARHGKVVIEA